MLRDGVRDAARIGTYGRRHPGNLRHRRHSINRRLCMHIGIGITPPTTADTTDMAAPSLAYGQRRAHVTGTAE
jgi:hypothetical protein